MPVNWGNLGHESPTEGGERLVTWDTNYIDFSGFKDQKIDAVIIYK
jgi:hypothetical protein